MEDLLGPLYWLLLQMMEHRRLQFKYRLEQTNRIMVKGTNRDFDVSNTNFTITAGSTDTIAPTAPTLAASGTTQTTTNLSWSGATDNVAVIGYDVYKDGALLGSTASTSYAVSGLTASTTFAFYSKS
jgi:hypothetical protein